jgi:uncharacterized protein (TIGR02646 family)
MTDKKPKNKTRFGGSEALITRLNDEFSGRCVYCETPFSTGTIRYIEHFRPASHYPELSLDVGNLLLVCDRCSASKGARFPLDEDGNPLLLNPWVDDFSEHVELQGTGVLKGLTPRGEATIAVLQLNRAELVDRRLGELIAKWLFGSLESERPDAYVVFGGSIQLIRTLNHKSARSFSAVEDRYLKNLLFANAIAALETYLADTFIDLVDSGNGGLRKFVESFQPFKEENFKLAQVFSSHENIKERALDELRRIMWHDLPKVSGMFRAAFGMESPLFADLMRDIVIRHDIVHRNGKKKTDGTAHVISSESVDGICDRTSEFVEKVQAEKVLAMADLSNPQKV